MLSIPKRILQHSLGVHHKSLASHLAVTSLWTTQLWTILHIIGDSRIFKTQRIMWIFIAPNQLIERPQIKMTWKVEVECWYKIALATSMLLKVLSIDPVDLWISRHLTQVQCTTHNYVIVCRVLVGLLEWNLVVSHQIQSCIKVRNTANWTRKVLDKPTQE